MHHDEKGGPASEVMRLFDSHCHLNDPKFKKDLQEVIERAKENFVQHVVVVGYDLKSSRKAIELAEAYPDFIRAAVAIHPHDADTVDDEKLEKLEELANQPYVVAIGETGLDYFKNYSPKEDQIRVFIEHIKLANKLSKPVILHIRDAFEDAFKILKEHEVEERGIFHCFSGGVHEAEEAVKMGYFVSFSGTVTFGGDELQEAAKSVPFETILIETDAPYLTPVPKRGRRNEPAFVYYVAKKIAELRGVTLEEVGERTYQNALQVFKIKEWS